MHGPDRNVTIRTNSRLAYPNRCAHAAERRSRCANEEHFRELVARELVSPVHHVRRHFSTLGFILFLGLLCTAPGCSVFHLAKRTVHYEPREYDVTLEEAEACKQYAIWAEEAWSEYQGREPGATTSANYYDGFRNGFVDYCFAGGSGEPPPIPPRRFWRTMYRNESGDRSFADWSAGFRAGASAARAGGYRKRAVVPPPSFQQSTQVAVAPEDPSAWQTDQSVLDGPSEYLDGTFDAGELLDAGPELVPPDSGTPATETPPNNGAASESIPDPYLQSPIENAKEPDSEASPPQSSSAEPRMLTAPIDENPLDQVPEIEPTRNRFDDFFRLPDDGNVPEGTEGDSATRLDFSPSDQQASTRMPTSNDENIDVERASWVLSETHNNKLRQPGSTTIPAGTDPIAKHDVAASADANRTAKEIAVSLPESAPTTKQLPSSRSPSKNATELAKQAQTLFQDSDDIEPVYTTYGNLFTDQP